MILWIAIALLTIIAVAIVAVPLIRERRGVGDAEHQAAVYEDQLAEVERDLSRGLVSAKEAASVRVEINRRVSQLKDELADGADPGSFQFRSVSLVLIALSLPVGALATYASLGSPNLPDAPYAERPVATQTATARAPSGSSGAAPQAAAATSPEDEQAMQQLIDGLGKRLEANPKDLDGWLLLARSYFQIRRFDQAADAFRKAFALAPKRADIAAAFGEMQVIRDRGQFSDGARKTFAAALALNPTEERSLFYTGMDLAQQGKHREALQSWVDLKAVSQPGAPWLAPLDARMAASAKAGGIDVSTLKPRVEPLASGPSQADIEAAQQMSPEERLKLVRSMVRGLAARLEANPNNPQGWQRLIRAYRVLGQEEKARDAERQFIAVQQRRGAPPTAQTPATPRGPTQEDIENAKGLSTRDRVQMVEGMVQRLAARLKEDPDNLSGWEQLARSYRVMGRMKKAREADARVKELREKLGVSTPPSGPPAATRAPASSPSRGPNRADIDAARQMSPQDRAAMIRGMVEGLAERLKDNPNDLAGWQRLTRAYRVTGETAKANEAQARVDALLAKQPSQ